MSHICPRSENTVRERSDTVINTCTRTHKQGTGYTGAGTWAGITHGWNQDQAIMCLCFLQNSIEYVRDKTATCLKRQSMHIIHVHWQQLNFTKSHQIISQEVTISTVEQQLIKRTHCLPSCDFTQVFRPNHDNYEICMYFRPTFCLVCRFYDLQQTASKLFNHHPLLHYWWHLQSLGLLCLSQQTGTRCLRNIWG